MFYLLITFLTCSILQSVFLFVIAAPMVYFLTSSARTRPARFVLILGLLLELLVETVFGQFCHSCDSPTACSGLFAGSAQTILCSTPSFVSPPSSSSSASWVLPSLDVSIRSLLRKMVALLSVGILAATAWKYEDPMKAQRSLLEEVRALKVSMDSMKGSGGPAKKERRGVTAESEDEDGGEDRRSQGQRARRPSLSGHGAPSPFLMPTPSPSHHFSTSFSRAEEVKERQLTPSPVRHRLSFSSSATQDAPFPFQGPTVEELEDSDWEPDAVDASGSPIRRGRGAAPSLRSRPTRKSSEGRRTAAAETAEEFALFIDNSRVNNAQRHYWLQVVAGGSPSWKDPRIYDEEDSEGWETTDEVVDEEGQESSPETSRFRSFIAAENATEHVRSGEDPLVTDLLHSASSWERTEAVAKGSEKREAFAVYADEAAAATGGDKRVAKRGKEGASPQATLPLTPSSTTKRKAAENSANTPQRIAKRLMKEGDAVRSPSSPSRLLPRRGSTPWRNDAM